MKPIFCLFILNASLCAHAWQEPLFEHALGIFTEAARPDPDALKGNVYIGSCLRRGSSSFNSALLVLRTQPDWAVPYMVFVGFSPYSFEGTTPQDMLNSSIARYPGVMGEEGMDILPIEFPDGDTTMAGELRVFLAADGYDYPVAVFTNEGEEPSMACIYDVDPA